MLASAAAQIGAVTPDFHPEVASLFECGRVHTSTYPRAEMRACRRLRLSGCGRGGKWARLQVASVDLSTRRHAFSEDVSP